MPIRHGLPVPSGETTILADTRAVVACDDATTTEHETHKHETRGEKGRWPDLPLLQLRWLCNHRLNGTRLPASLFDPTPDLPTPSNENTNDPVDTGGLTLPFVRAHLLRKDTNPLLLDRIWRYVITVTRARRGQWNLFALGLGLSGLLKEAVKLAPKNKTPYPQIFAVHQMLAAEFLIRLHHDRFDLDRPRVYSRLKAQCVYAAKGDWRAANRDLRTLVDLEQYLSYAETVGGRETARITARPLGSERGDAYLALARLVRRKALSRVDAALVALTYVDGHTVAQAAQWLRLTEPTARGRHHRAKQRLAKLLQPTGQAAEPTQR